MYTVWLITDTEGTKRSVPSKWKLRYQKQFFFCALASENVENMCTDSCPISVCHYATLVVPSSCTGKYFYFPTLRMVQLLNCWQAPADFL